MKMATEKVEMNDALQYVYSSVLQSQTNIADKSNQPCSNYSDFYGNLK